MMLEAKAKYYDEVVVGKKLTGYYSIWSEIFKITKWSFKIKIVTEEGDDELFLVDFDKKAVEASSSGFDREDRKYFNSFFNTFWLEEYL